MRGLINLFNLKKLVVINVCIEIYYVIFKYVIFNGVNLENFFKYSN